MIQIFIFIFEICDPVQNGWDNYKILKTKILKIFTFRSVACVCATEGKNVPLTLNINTTTYVARNEKNQFRSKLEI